MFRIVYFDKMCGWWNQDQTCLEGSFSIWSFSLSSFWKALTSFLPCCRAEYFPVMYWLVLLISIFGSWYSAVEFTTLYLGQRKRISIWRRRKFYVLPYKMLVKWRLLGSLMMLTAWLMLGYAVIIVSPAHMTPWLTINTCMLSVEIVTWIIEVLVGTIQLELHHVMSFALPIMNFLFVRCVRKVFQQAIDENDADDLKLF